MEKYYARKFILTGTVAGIYRKKVSTPAEIRRGIRAGKSDQPPVMLDGLRIGTAICFDENFPDQIWHWIDAVLICWFFRRTPLPVN
ncbi:MAG: hypothetical protein WC959_12865 [Kiritimatiellales bacterium]